MIYYFGVCIVEEKMDLKLNRNIKLNNKSKSKTKLSNLGVNVFTDNMANNPFCEHGPSVLFERVLENGVRKRFFACSACRDRKQCSFYLSADKNASIPQKTIFDKQDKYFQMDADKYTSCKTLIEKYPKDICYCATCSNIILQSQIDSSHSKCIVIQNFEESLLTYPSYILTPLSNSKTEAQYLFKDKSIKVILELLIGINCKKILSIGTPRIHEEVTSNKEHSLSSLLLDIDRRFSCFFPPTEFLKYNLFNHYFFGGRKAKDIYKKFLSENKKIALIMDPPFGGRMELIANTIKIIEEEWRQANNLTELDTLPVMLIFPYFMERTVLANLPEFIMLDYKVDYDNHAIYTTGPKGMKHGSAVRIYVNQPASRFSLANVDGYRFCSHCQKWVYENNLHCIKCNSCTSKDGRTYKHCDLCGNCVKPSWVHCELCKLCKPFDHSCITVSANELGCFSCGLGGHKKKECPKKRKKITMNNAKKKRKKNLPQTRIEENERNKAVLHNILKNY